MAENDPTPTASEPNPAEAGASQGSGGDGAAGGAAGADSFAAEREQYEARVRSFQSEADKAKERVAQLERELAAKESGASGGETPTPSGLTEDAVRQVMRREQARARELADAVQTVRSQFPNASPTVFAALDSYESADDLLVAARASHDQLSAHLAEREKAIEEDIRKRYAAVHGELPAPPDTGGEGAGAGAMTLEKLSAMTYVEFEAWVEANPEEYARLSRSA